MFLYFYVSKYLHLHRTVPPKVLLVQSFISGKLHFVRMFHLNQFWKEFCFFLIGPKPGAPLNLAVTSKHQTLYFSWDDSNRTYGTPALYYSLEYKENM